MRDEISLKWGVFIPVSRMRLNKVGFVKESHSPWSHEGKQWDEAVTLIKCHWHTYSNQWCMKRISEIQRVCLFRSLCCTSPRLQPIQIFWISEPDAETRLVGSFGLTYTKIRSHYGKMANCVSPNQIQIQIGLVLIVWPDTCDDTAQPCASLPF